MFRIVTAVLTVGLLLAGPLTGSPRHAPTTIDRPALVASLR